MATKTLPAPSPVTADADRREASDNRDAKIRQLVALTATLSGEGFESFSRYSEDVQGSVLWLVHELAADVERFNDAAEGNGPKDATHD
jgi:hypothetical protein